MKTKEQRISEMIGKTYGFIKTGKIEIIFSGKLGTVKVMLRNRRQVLEVLKRFYNDEFGIMDWVDTVIINNPYEGWVKVNGAWKWRKKVIEIKITKKQVSRETKSDKKKVQSQKMKKTTKKQNTIKEIDGNVKIQKLNNGMEMIVIEQTKEQKAAIFKEFDKWIKVGNYEVNWSRKEYKYKGGVVKKFRSKMNMLSKLMNQPGYLTNQQGEYHLEESGVEGIKANWQDLILVDDYHEKRFKTAAAMKNYLKWLKKLKEQERQQMLTFGSK